MRSSAPKKDGPLSLVPSNLKLPKDPQDIRLVQPLFPKKAKEGKGKMDYSDSGLAFPKPAKKKKKGRWGKK